MKTLSISQAKQKLGKVADDALEGKPTLIVRKSKLLVLQAYSVPEPIPQRPAGYFADCYTTPEIEEANYLANQAGDSIAP
jgi:hypothetical protein